MPDQAPPPLQPFRYHGPSSGVSLRKTPCGKPLEVLFFDGAVVAVPAEHPYIKTLVARGHLTPIETPAAVPAAPATSPITTTSSSRPTKAKASAQESND